MQHFLAMKGAQAGRDLFDDAARARVLRMHQQAVAARALHQPVAADLRFVVSVLKINNDLERIGDLAVNIAEAARRSGRSMDAAYKALNRLRKLLHDCVSDQLAHGGAT